MISPETEKEIYENLDAVWARLPQDDTRELFLQLMWTTCSRHVIPVFIRWQKDRIPKTPRYRKEPGESTVPFWYETGGVWHQT